MNALILILSMNPYIFISQAILIKKKKQFSPNYVWSFNSKEKNYENVSPKQNGVCQKNKCVRFLMDSGASSSIIHVTYVSRNDAIMSKASANK